MKNLPKYIDLLFCLVVLPVMFIMFPIERWYHHFRTYMVSLGVWLYLLYFINRCFTVPALFGSGRRKVRGVAIIILSFTVTYIFSSITLYTPPPNRLDDGIVKLFPTVKQYQQAVWSLFMIVEAFSFAVGLFTQAGLQKARRREVEAQRDRAELELYKAQIKPHFMFNTLNSLYGLFLTGSGNALPSLERFIQLMRYLHTSASREAVALSEEADYIRQYVELQSLRLNEKTRVELDISVDDPSLSLPPMLLVTFVENCFKHGVSPAEESKIEITLSESEGRLRLHTRNRIFPVARIGEHMGIANCKRRLDLSYPGHHWLKISDDGEYYDVELKIELSE